jgi:mRNA deadenylase 3'-5' endonuclease subunit Ccr4
MVFSIVSWNVLANAYVRPQYFPHTPRSVLDWSQRQPALADLICLQEVEPGLHERLLTRLGPIGYAGHFFRKGRAKPDGCSTFFRRDTPLPSASQPSDHLPISAAVGWRDPEES